jgi:hypothetical protein
MSAMSATAGAQSKAHPSFAADGRGLHVRRLGGFSRDGNQHMTERPITETDGMNIAADNGAERRTLLEALDAAYREARRRQVEEAAQSRDTGWGWRALRLKEAIQEWLRGNDRRAWVLFCEAGVMAQEVQPTEKELDRWGDDGGFVPPDSE